MGGMGLLKKLSGLLGFGKDEDQQQHEGVADASIASFSSSPTTTTDTVPTLSSAQTQHLPRKGFSVPVQVPVERATLPPLLTPCDAGDGGVQGLRWYARRLRIDEDGDVADEFLDEVLPDTSTSMEEQNRPLPRFAVKHSTKPAKVRNQALLPNGKIQHHVEYKGRLEWV